MNKTSYDAWIHDQLSPDERKLHTGKNYMVDKYRHKNKWGKNIGKPPHNLTREEDERRQDEFLKRNGIQ